jgi:hypothetical protein
VLALQHGGFGVIEVMGRGEARHRPSSGSAGQLLERACRVGAAQLGLFASGT